MDLKIKQMTTVDFLVDSVDDTGFVIGKNGDSAVPVGTVFNLISKIRIDGDTPDLKTIDLGKFAEVALILKEVECFRRSLAGIPHGYSADCGFPAPGWTC
ncbi:MAG: hypothetical protein RL748_4352 [Pseudomonadota bacterium]|jgi:hypothetical protein